MKSLLASIYGPQASFLHKEIKKLQKHYKIKSQGPTIDQKEVFLITYADTIQSPGKKHFKTFKLFSDHYLRGLFSTIHFLPFYPYSSDDGFSILDYKKVRPSLGTWNDLKSISKDYNLMFDCVINHLSVKSNWFKKHPDYFISFKKKEDTSMVFRPRTHPLLTKIKSRYFWTTFSADQADLNYDNPQVLLKIIDILLFYTSKGASYLRFDAIAYLYKKLGTTCLSLPQTHTIIKILRQAIPASSKIISEVNLYQKEILTYLGKGESQAVYNLPLAPLVLYCLNYSDSTPLYRFLKGLKDHSPNTTYLNLLATHDGIGLLPSRGYLNDKQRTKLTNDVIKKGFKASSYEMNINYFDALDQDPRKMLLAHAILLSIKGIPGIYIHSLIGSYGKKKYDKVHPRSVNREQLNFKKLNDELHVQDNIRSIIYHGIAEMTIVRKQHSAFHPHASQTVSKKGKNILIIKRQRGKSNATCYYNLSAKTKKISDLELGPYEFAWRLN